MNHPAPGRCTATAVHMGYPWNPTLRFITCADQSGKLREIPTGDEKALRELLGPFGELLDKVVIPIGGAL